MLRNGPFANLFIPCGCVAIALAVLRGKLMSFGLANYGAN